MEAVGYCPSKRLLRGPSFFPDERQLVLLQHTGQSERRFLKKETRMAQPWHHHHHHHHPWHCDTPHSPDDQSSGSRSVDGKCLRTLHTDEAWYLWLQFYKPLKKVSWLHSLDGWHRSHCDAHQCSTGVYASVEVVVMLKSGVHLFVCVKAK